ncbi:MAG TPA: ketopantoate reductase family protein, partial [Vicinamibacteria bacterium]|nr:ketopantoate reductase family protein [Vicinamibacteria bacterium]
RRGRPATLRARRRRGPLRSALASVLVFGTGALATFLGGRLSRAGHDVTLAGTWAAALAAIARDGLRVEEADGSFTATARVHDLASRPDPASADFVLVLVKAHRTASVAPAAAAAARGGGPATLQNGLGNREALEEAAGPGRVLVGATTAGATLLGPGRVRGHVAETVVGETRDGRAGALAALLQGAGLPARLAPDVDRLLWSKLAANCAINPLTALHGVSNGALLERPEWRSTMAAAAAEVAAVAAARGLRIPEPAELAFDVARATAGNRSSMLQDVERGAATEIDALSGAVVREGRRLGVPTPVNAALLEAVREHEAAAAPR